MSKNESFSEESLSESDDGRIVRPGDKIEIPKLNVEDDILVKDVITMSIISDFISLYNAKTENNTLPPSILHLKRFVTLIRYVSSEGETELQNKYGTIVIEDGAAAAILFFASKSLPLALDKYYKTNEKSLVKAANNAVRGVLTSCNRIMSAIRKESIYLFTARIMSSLCSLILSNADVIANHEKDPSWIKRFVSMTIKTSITTIFTLKLDQITKKDNTKKNSPNEKKADNQVSLELSIVIACSRFLGSVTADKDDLYPQTFRYNIIKNITTEFFKIYGRQTVTNYSTYCIIRDIIFNVVINSKEDALVLALAGVIRAFASHVRYVFSDKGQLFLSQNKKRGNKNDDDEEKRKKKEKKIEAITKESVMYRNLLGWNFMTGLEFWCDIASIAYQNNRKSKIAMLLFPLVEIAINIVSSLPNGLRFAPGKLRLMEKLSDIISRTGLYIPLYRITCLLMTEVLKPSSASKTDVAVQKWRSKIFSQDSNGFLSFNFIMIAPKELTEAVIYRKTVARNTLSIMAKFLNSEAVFRPEAFPETTTKGVVYLGHLLKAIKGAENYPGTDYIVKTCPRYLLTFQKTYSDMVKDIKNSVQKFSSKITETRRLMGVCPNDFYVFKQNHGINYNIEMASQDIDENATRVLPFIKAIAYPESELAINCKKFIIEIHKTTVNIDENNEAEDFDIDDNMLKEENNEWEKWSSDDDNDDDDDDDDNEFDGDNLDNNENAEVIDYNPNLTAEEAKTKFKEDEIADLEISDAED